MVSRSRQMGGELGRRRGTPSSKRRTSKPNRGDLPAVLNCDSIIGIIAGFPHESKFSSNGLKGSEEACASGHCAGESSGLVKQNKGCLKFP